MFARRWQIPGIAIVCCHCLLAAGARGLAADPPAAPPPLITSAVELRKAKVQRGDYRHRVDLTAVVIRLGVPFHHPDHFTAQDETGGISAFCAKRKDGSLAHFPKEVQIGMRVRIRGYAVPGSFGNGLQLENPPQVEVLGPAELPPIRELTREDILSGAYHAMRAEVRGVLREVKIKDDQCVVAAHGQRVICTQIGRNLIGQVGARVRIRGTCFAIWNSSNQSLGVRIWSRPEDDSPLIEQPAPPAGQLPVRSSRELFDSRGEWAVDDRARIRGTVLFHRPGNLYLRDRDGGLRISCAETTPLQPGEVVEVLGFPRLGELAPMLEDAVVQRLQAGTPPPPVELGGTELLADSHEADLVQIRARLVDVSSSARGLTLLLKPSEQGPSFTAVLDAPIVDPRLKGLRSGAILETRGICRLTAGTQLSGMGLRTADDLTLLLRGPDDIRVIEAAPWWTLPRILIVLGSTVALAVAAGAWAALLRHRVNLQTEVIRAKVGRESVHEDRLRIARELHDTLAQELNGIGRQAQAILRSLDDRDRARAQVEQLQEMIRISRHDARNAVWDLRDEALLSEDLGTALRVVASRVTLGSETRVEVQVAPEVPPRLPHVIESNLLRFVQEAVANAVKHGRAGLVTIQIGMDGTSLRVSVSDNGCGCSSEDLELARPGRFGVRGMQERIEKLDGRFHIESGLGAGVRVLAVIPMPEKPADLQQTT
jgi:signal transduction histidine kinase